MRYTIKMPVHNDSREGVRQLERPESFQHLHHSAAVLGLTRKVPPSIIGVAIPGRMPSVELDTEMAEIEVCSILLDEKQKFSLLRNRQLDSLG